MIYKNGLLQAKKNLKDNALVISFGYFMYSDMALL